MITPKLEELIMCGDAEYRTFGCAHSSNFKLDLPKDGLIVVTDLIWNHFIQSYDNNPSLDNWIAATGYQIRFYDTNRKYFHLLVRNSLNIVPSQNLVFTTPQALGSVNTRMLIFPAPPQQFNLYFPLRKFMQINVIKLERARNLTYQYNQIVDRPGQLDNVPIDTGGAPGGLNTITHIENPVLGTDNLSNYPQGVGFTPVPLPSAVANNDYVQLNDQRYQMLNPSGMQEPENATPMFTVGYVLIRDSSRFSALSDKK